MSTPFDGINAALDAREVYDPTLRLHGVRFLDSGALQLDLQLDDTARWRVWADGALDWRIVSAVADPLEFHESHELLRPFQEPWAELTFYGRPHSVLQALGALWKAAASWSVRGTGFFTMPPAELLEGGFGQLACGPASLIAALQGVLNRFEIKTSVLPRAREHDVPGSALLEFGDNYIIAAGYRVEPVVGRNE